MSIDSFNTLISCFTELHITEAKQVRAHLANKSCKPKERLEKAFKIFSTSKQFTIELDDLYSLFNSLTTFTAVSDEKKLLRNDQFLRKFQALFSRIPEQHWSYNTLSFTPRSISLQALSDTITKLARQVTKVISPKDSDVCTAAIRCKLALVYIESIKTIQEWFDEDAMKIPELMLLARRCQVVSRKNELINEICRLIPLIFPQGSALPKGLGAKLTAIAAPPLTTNCHELHIRSAKGSLQVCDEESIKIEFPLE